MLKGMDGYVNEDGFVTVEKDANPFPGEGNGWLQTGVAVACGFDYDPTIIMKMFIRCRYGITPLMWRSPHKKNLGDNQNHDDYWSIGLLSWKYKLDWAREFVEFGAKFDWIYDVTDPTGGNLRYKFDRFLDFVPYMRLCAGEKLTIADKFILAGTIIYDAYHPDKADANMRSFCKVTVAEKQGGLLCKMAGFWWRKRIKSKYGTIGNSWAKYFGEGHPLNAFNDDQN
jgi:hypothetical protein